MRLTMILILLNAGPGNVLAQSADQVQIRPTRIQDGLYMLEGAGGNMAVSFGEDGTFLIDDQYAPLTEKIKAAIRVLTPTPVAFVINTHWHFDHTGGNENFGRDGSVIVSHENSRIRMESDQLVEFFNQSQPAYAPAGLPKITFDQSVRFRLNGDTIDVFHLGRAHTDGDAIVFFRRANVVHTGDVFMTLGFPFIDQPNGGSIDGVIDVVRSLSDRIDDDTVIIPGHGRLSRRSDLVAYGDMLTTIRDRVATLVNQGASFEAIVESNPTEGFLGGGIPIEAFVRIIYDSLRSK